MQYYQQYLQEIVQWRAEDLVAFDEMAIVPKDRELPRMRAPAGEADTTGMLAPLLSPVPLLMVVVRAMMMTMMRIVALPREAL